MIKKNWNKRICTFKKKKYFKVMVHKTKMGEKERTKPNLCYSQIRVKTKVTTATFTHRQTDNPWTLYRRCDLKVMSRGQLWRIAWLSLTNSDIHTLGGGRGGRSHPSGGHKHHTPPHKHRFLFFILYIKSLLKVVKTGKIWKKHG